MTMFANTRAFSGFAVGDLQAAQKFYGEVLGIATSEQNGLMTLHLAGGRDTLVYPKPGHVPADYTILNFPVDDIDSAVDELTARGVTFERYDGAGPGRQGNQPRLRARHRLVPGPGREHPGRPQGSQPKLAGPAWMPPAGA